MIYINCEQGTPEWHRGRCGVTTASMFRVATEFKRDGSRTEAALLYAAQLAIERATGDISEEGYTSWQMERGKEKEPRGRMTYEARTGNCVTEGGICLTDDRLFGYSTDGFVDDDGLIEIKSLVSAKGIVDILRDGDLSEYMHQMQGGLWLTGRKWCDFIMYCPQLKSIGKELYYRRVKRNEAFIEKLESDLVNFNRLVEDNVAILRGD